MIYEEYDPGPRLRHAVRCFWVLSGAGGGTAPERIVPDGCMELIFHFGDRFERILRPGVSELQPRAILAGQLTGPLLLRPTGRTGFIAARFLPHGAAAFTREPMSALRDRVLAARDVPGLDLSAVEDSLGVAVDNPARVEILRAFLDSRLRVPVPPVVVRAIQILREMPGESRLGQVRTALGVHERTLERLFQKHVGIGPKQYARIVRFHRVFELMERGFDLTRIAHDLGFADQPHFNREFRSIAGLSPKQFAAERPGLTGELLRA